MRKVIGYLGLFGFIVAAGALSEQTGAGKRVTECRPPSEKEKLVVTLDHGQAPFCSYHPRNQYGMAPQ